MSQCLVMWRGVYGTAGMESRLVLRFADNNSVPDDVLFRIVSHLNFSDVV